MTSDFAVWRKMCEERENDRKMSRSFVFLKNGWSQLNRACKSGVVVNRYSDDVTGIISTHPRGERAKQDDEEKGDTKNT
jgi:hypothetical protein